MLNIIPLQKADRQTVRDMAETAAANGEPVSSNPFPPSHQNHHHWNSDFHQFDMQLTGTG